MTIAPDAIDVAVDTLAYIKTHPDEWDQCSWRSCFAGHFARLDPLVQEHASESCACGCGARVTSLTAADGQVVSVPDWFTERLGGEAAQMTYGLRTIDELEAAVIALKEGTSVEEAMMRARILPLLRRGDTDAP